MYQLPQEIWNQIAHENELKTEWAKKMFNLTAEEIYPELDREGEILERKGYSDKAIISFQTGMPLMETEAITNFIVTHNQPELRQPLPEVNSIRDCLKIMTMEYNLEPGQAKEFCELIELCLQDKLEY